MNRRNFITAGAVTAALAATPKINAEKKPATFVLVHGTWHGGWVWRDVRNILRTQGHQVFTPTCTGCGERAHLSSPAIGMETHIQDIVNVIEFEELNDVILVGHSFSGFTITGVADRIKHRIKKIIFFDAVVPREGVTAAVMPDANTGELPGWWKKNIPNFKHGYQMDFWAKYPMEMLVPETETVHAERLKRLITTHPAKTWTDQISLSNGGWQGLSPTFIHCVGQTYQKSSEWMIGPARGKNWQFIELDIPRDGMLTHPQLVADTFAKFA